MPTLQKRIKEFRFLFLFLTLPSFGFGADYYVAQNSAGNNNGTDCADAYSVTWFNTAGNWGSGAGKIGPGNTVHLCGTIATPLTVQGSGSAGNPITLLFESGAKLSTTTWAAGTGMINVSNKSYIVVDGNNTGIIEATDNGTLPAFGGTHAYASHIYGMYLFFCSNCEIKNLTIQTIYDRLANSPDCNTFGIGINMSGDLSGNSIHNCNVSGEWIGISAGPEGATMTNGFSIHDNTTSNAGVGLNFAPANATSAGGTNIGVYNNTDTGGGSGWEGSWPTSGCGCVDPFVGGEDCGTGYVHRDGMHIFTDVGTDLLSNVSIFNNYTQDFGTQGNATGHIYVEGAEFSNVKIYNNVMVDTGLNSVNNGMLTIKATPNVRIYNNTFVGAGPTVNNIAIFFNNRVSTYSVGSIMENNIISGVKDFVGWNGVLGTDTIFSSDYNDHFNGDPSEPYTGLPRSAWVALGYDVHGTVEDPQLDSNENLTASTQSGSLHVRNGGINLNAQIGVLDKAGNARPAIGSWDIGAYEYATAPVNVAPGLNAALVYPDPVTPPYSPTIRICPGGPASGGADIGVTIFDVSGRAVNSSDAFNFIGVPTQGMGAGQFECYEYTWTGHIASGVYFAVVHAKGSGTTVKAKLKFAVIR